MSPIRMPKTDLVRDYLDGSLPSEQMSEAERIIQNDPAACTTPDEHDKLETFISRLQEALAMPPFPSERNEPNGERIRQAVAEQVKQSAANDTAAFASGDPMLSTDSEAPSGEKGTSAFLSPPQAAGEMGRLNGYRVLKLLGQGGMGMVFEAEDIRLERRVALKVMKPEVAAKEQHRIRFIREARTAAKVEHDHICPIYQVGEENGVPFIAMPFLKGEPLDIRMKRQKPLPIDEAIRIGREVAEGLAAAHDAGLVHRDIKPGNVWLESTDRLAATRRVSGGERSSFRVRILDFGLARLAADDVHLTQSGAIMGTPAYMAPEQARGKTVDHRADLFSLGVMLYEMTTGRRPFTGGDTMSILTSLAVDNPTAPNLINFDVPADLSDLILRLLAKSPEKRPADARAVSEALLAILMQTSRPIVEAMPAATSGVASAPRGIANPPARGAYTSALEATAVDPWEAIDDTQTSEAPVNCVAKPQAASSRSRLRLSVTIAAAFLFVIGTGFAAYKLFFETKDGTLVVEVSDDADVRFKNGELQIFGADGKLKYTLKPGERDKKMPPGKYTIQVVSTDGIKLDTDKFEMAKDGKVILRVTADGVAMAKKQSPKVDGAKDPDRRAAEYVLSIGGMVRVNHLDNDITKAADLPRESFRVTVVVLNNNEKVNDADFAVFQNCKNLTKLSLENVQVTDAALAHFKDCKNLTVLWLNGTHVSDAGLAHFKDCENLTLLNLGGTKVADAGLAHFKDCKNLTHLILSGTKVTDAGLANFKDCKGLLELQLDSTKVSDAGLANFKDCKNLGGLHLGGTKVTDAGLAPFKDCKNLAQLSLAGTQVSDLGLEHFKGCKNLVVLALYEMQVSDKGLDNFKDCKNLAHLAVQRTKVTAAKIDELKKTLPQCRIEWEGGIIEPMKSPDRKAAEYVLSIGGVVKVNNGVDREIKAVRDLPPGAFELSLVFLGNDSNLKDADLARFKDCANLRHLDLSNTAVTLTGLVFLKDCKNLTALVLDDTELSDSCVAALKGFKNLTQIYLEGTKFTAVGIAELKKAFPQCQIKWDRRVSKPKPSPHPDRRAAEWVLSIGGKVAIDGKFWERITKTADLPAAAFRTTSIDLSDNRHVTAAGLKNLAGLSKIEALNLVRCGPEVNQATEIIGDLTTLTGLDLTGCGITDQGFKQLKKLSNGLQHLYLADNRFTDAVLEDLEQFTKLQVFGPDPSMSWAGIARLKFLKNVTGLQLLALNITDADLALFKDLPKLQNLSLNYNQQITDAGLENLYALKKLASLTLQGTKVTADGVKKLAAALPGCKIEWDGGTIESKPSVAGRRAAEYVLSIGGTVTISVNGETRGIKAAANLPPQAFLLTAVNLSNTRVTDLGLANFKDCKNLTSLNLHDAEVSDAGLAHFKDCKNLTNLDLSNVSKAGDAGLSHFKDCKGLTNLVLYGTKVTDAGLVHFKDCKKLSQLNLNDTQVSDLGLAHFKEFAKLKFLALQKTKVTAKGVAELNKELPQCQIEWDGGVIVPVGNSDRKAAEWLIARNAVFGYSDATGYHQIGQSQKIVLPPGAFVLNNFKLSGAQFTSDSDLAPFRGLEFLNTIVLGETAVSDAGLKHLATLPKLDRLYLSRTKVTDAGMAHLGTVKMLAYLDINDTSVTDVGLPELNNCKNLTHITLLKTKVTAAGIDGLEKALPQCKIEWDGGVIEPKK